MTTTLGPESPASSFNLTMSTSLVIDFLGHRLHVRHANRSSDVGERLLALARPGGRTWGWLTAGRLGSAIVIDEDDDRNLVTHRLHEAQKAVVERPHVADDRNRRSSLGERDSGRHANGTAETVGEWCGIALQIYRRTVVTGVSGDWRQAKFFRVGPQRAKWT